jgi:hypothetical protein
MAPGQLWRFGLQDNEPTTPLVSASGAHDVQRRGIAHGADPDSDSCEPTRVEAVSATGRVHLRSIKKTIEFRQHEATLDPDRAINRVETVVGPVERADEAERGVWFEFLIGHAGSEDRGQGVITLCELFRPLGMHRQAACYGAPV